MFYRGKNAIFNKNLCPVKILKLKVGCEKWLTDKYRPLKCQPESIISSQICYFGVYEL
jgi:hypothetical protein